MKSELIRLQSIHGSENNSTLRGVDFKIYKGEAVGLVGGFHSGKMLLMETIAGTYIPDRGYRFLHGKMVSFSYPAVDLRVKHLKKNFGLIGPLTVWENIATYHRNKKQFSWLFMPERMRSQVKEMLTLYGICTDPGITVDRLTAIQKFAVALIKAKLEGAELILAEGSELEYSVAGFHLMEQLLILCRKQGMSVMFSGIDLGGFSPLLDRICLIDAGRIIWEERVQKCFLKETASTRRVGPVRLNIPVERYPMAGVQARSIKISGEQFSITGMGGQFLMLFDPEQELAGDFADIGIRAVVLQKERREGKGQEVRVRQIDFSNFDRLVKWMSPADNLIFGLSSKTGRFGVVRPHLKRYILTEFVQWTGEERYLELKDCASLMIGDRIKMAAFRLKMDRPDVVVFRNFQFLDQASREIVLPVMADLLKAGTLLTGISTLDKFSDFADGYFLMLNGECSQKMDYRQIQEVLAEGGDQAYERE